MVSRAVAWGFATHNLPNWTRCGYVLYNTHDTVDIVHCTRLTECNIAEHCSASKPNPRAETDNYLERNGGAGSSKLGARSIIWPGTQLSHYQLLSSSKLSAHALPNYHLTRLHNYHIITLSSLTDNYHFSAATFHITSPVILWYGYDHKVREELMEGCWGKAHPAPDCAASRSSISNVAFLGAMMQLRGSPLTQRLLFWLDED